MPDAVLTKNRQTTVEFNTGPQNLLCFPTHYITRLAGQMTVNRQADVAETQGVKLVPGVNAWILNPLHGFLSQAVVDPAFTGSLVEPAETNRALSVESYRMYAPPNDLPGVNATTPVTSFPSYIKSPSAGSSWNVSIPLPDPPLPERLQLITGDVDPVLSTKVTDPPNQGYVFLFTVPRADMGLVGFVQFSFGGPADTDPAPETGDQPGRFCLRLDGDGQAVLYERVTAASGRPWTIRKEFPYTTPFQAQGNVSLNLVTVQPLGRDHVVFQAGTADALVVDGFTLPIGALTSTKLQHAHYENSKAGSGFTKLNWSSGAGTVDVAIKRELRTSFSIARLKYPTSGTLVDMPFTLPWPKIPAGTEMALLVESEEMPGTSITPRMFVAETHQELEANEDGRYETLEDVGRYYLRFDFVSDGAQTPLLKGYSVDVNGFREVREVTPTTGGNLREISVTMPDLDPSQAMASCTIKDVRAELGTLLSAQSGMPCRIKTTDQGVSVILHEGLLAEARGKRRGDGNRVGGANQGALRVFPSQNWKDYQCRFLGMFSRIQRQVSLCLENFSKDLNAAPNPVTGQQPPWKITDIIRYVFTKYGYVAAELDIPDLDVRMWNLSLSEVTLQPTVSAGEFVQHLAKDYLGSALVWCPNASVNGMWRLILNPQAPFTPIATFLGEPSGTGKLPTHPNSYADNETFIIRNSFDTVVYPPECNFVLASGTGQLLPDGKPTQTLARIYNPVSFNFDPSRPTADTSHPDHIGEMVPVLLIDPRIRTPEEAAYLARRIYDRAAHAEKWFTFSAPALYVTVAGDSYLTGKRRPLRVNDVIRVLGQDALVRTASYAWKRDTMQVMEVQGKFLT